MPKLKKLYEAAKSAKVGSTCKCPSCGTEFVKTNYHQAFCKSKGGTICKDKYWNTVTPQNIQLVYHMQVLLGWQWKKYKEIHVYDVNPYENESDHGQWTD